ncbi:MAG: hypothetical protein M1826_001882 [Phylliscum demangeonii]|nr:MAG: hypothetical protein M1826_001882 [Phylliscum demangeonii]
MTASYGQNEEINAGIIDAILASPNWAGITIPGMNQEAKAVHLIGTTPAGPELPGDFAAPTSLLDPYDGPFALGTDFGPSPIGLDLGLLPLEPEHELFAAQPDLGLWYPELDLALPPVTGGIDTTSAGPQLHGHLAAPASVSDPDFGPSPVDPTLKEVYATWDGTAGNPMLPTAPPSQATGSRPGDVTAFFEPHRHWSIDNLPDILYQWKKTGHNTPTYTPEPRKDPATGEVVKDPGTKKTIRMFRNIPATVSSALEGWLIEAILREDSRITLKDLFYYIPEEFRGEIKDEHVFQVRSNRFRQRYRLISWNSRGKGSRWDRQIEKDLSAAQKAGNTTKGLAPYDAKVFKTVKKTTVESVPQRGRKRKVASSQTGEEVDDTADARSKAANEDSGGKAPVKEEDGKTGGEATARAGVRRVSKPNEQHGDAYPPNGEPAQAGTDAVLSASDQSHAAFVPAVESDAALTGSRAKRARVVEAPGSQQQPPATSAGDLQPTVPDAMARPPASILPVVEMGQGANDGDEAEYKDVFKQFINDEIEDGRKTRMEE